jgi:hypothetical protein
MDVDRTGNILYLGGAGTTADGSVQNASITAFSFDHKMQKIAFGNLTEGRSVNRVLRLAGSNSNSREYLALAIDNKILMVCHN